MEHWNCDLEQRHIVIVELGEVVIRRKNCKILVFLQHPGTRMTDKKMHEIRYNGKVIGSIPDTGDQQQMHQEALALLARNGIDLSKGKASQLTALGQARSFGKATELIYQAMRKTSGWDPNLITPLIVNSAFCIEVFLKAIGRLCNQGMKERHELSPLFEQLPAQLQTELQLAFEERLQAHGLPPSQLIDGLGAMNDAFKRWRYLYESDSRLDFEVGVAFAAIEALDYVSTKLAAAA